MNFVRSPCGPSSGALAALWSRPQGVPLPRSRLRGRQRLPERGLAAPPSAGAGRGSGEARASGRVALQTMDRGSHQETRARRAETTCVASGCGSKLMTSKAGAVKPLARITAAPFTASVAC